MRYRRFRKRACNVSSDDDSSIVRRPASKLVSICPRPTCRSPAMRRRSSSWADRTRTSMRWRKSANRCSGRTMSHHISGESPVVSIHASRIAVKVRPRFGGIRCGSARSPVTFSIPPRCRTQRATRCDACGGNPRKKLLQFRECPGIQTDRRPSDWLSLSGFGRPPSTTAVPNLTRPLRLSP